jgi:ATP-dependent Lon protease
MLVDLLPLFPLKMVALPGALVPLHIFEERYKEMVGIAIEHQTEFGIVLAHEQGVANVGCSVAVDKVLQRYQDGRLDILCLGKRRFHVVELNSDLSYLRGSVQFFDDDQAAASDELTKLQDEAYSAWRQLANRLGVNPLPEIAPRDPHLSFLLGQAVTALSTRQLLLQLRSEAERLRHLVTFFRDFEMKQARIREAKRLAPTNGHAKHLGSKN